jgi:hypothetical protein
VRRTKSLLRGRVNGNLSLRFSADGLTSYAGLELLRWFMRRLRFSERLRKHLRDIDPAGDYSSVELVRLVVALLVVGASRLRHLGFVDGDPLVKRFSGLSQMPSARTLGRWLSRCTSTIQEALLRLNGEIVAETIRFLRLPSLTLDIDGSVLSTGLTVEWAHRGYNPHDRKAPSYYPITAHVAQTGQVLRVKNRPGNVHDGKASLPFFRDLFRQLEEDAPGARIEVRLDAAFFRSDVISFLEHRSEYAIKVPFWHFLGIKGLIKQQRKWKKLTSGLEAFETTLHIGGWKRDLRVVVYRKHVAHESPKNFQLDLFDPSDGHWEYSAITTNKRLGLRALWDFMCGRGAHEKVYAELKTGYAFDAIPTRNYAANSAWQILSVLSHNLVTAFQIETGAPRRPANAKRSPIVLLKRIATLRYEFFGRAGILQRPQGTQTLSLAPSAPVQRQFGRIQDALARAA